MSEIEGLYLVEFDEGENVWEETENQSKVWEDYMFVYIMLMHAWISNLFHGFVEAQVATAFFLLLLHGLRVAFVGVLDN